MNKTVFVILFSVIAIVFAANESWDPVDLDAISAKCHEENLLPPDTELDLGNIEGIDKSRVYAVFLCKAKAINIYNEKTGFHVDRLKNYFISNGQFKCAMPFVQECVDENQKIASDGEKVFKVVVCIADKEREMLRKGC